MHDYSHIDSTLISRLIESGFTGSGGVYERTQDGDRVRVIIARAHHDSASTPSQADVFISGMHIATFQLFSQVSIESIMILADKHAK